MGLCRELPDLVRVQHAPARDAGGLAEVPQLLQVALIMFAGIGSQAAFRPQVMQEAVYPVLQVIRHADYGM